MQRLTQAELPGSIYQESALRYHNEVVDILVNAESFARENAGYPAQPVQSAADVLAELRVQVDNGIALPSEPVKVASLLDLAKTLNQHPPTYISEMDLAFDRWRADEGVTLTTAPVAFHSSHILQEIFTNSQATLADGGPTGPGSIGFRDDDGMLCDIDHRNWVSERLNLCGAASNEDAAISLSAAVQAGLASAATDFLEDEVSDVLFNVEDASDLNFTQQIATNFVVGAIENVLENFINNLWNEIWCREDCDDCGPAIGIGRVIQNCNFVGIRAVGSPFEFAERFRYKIDLNLDGVIDDDPELLGANPVLPSAAIGHNGNAFNARVDVFCDGQTEFQWPGTGSRTWVRVVPNAALLTNPSVTNVSAPMRVNGFAYRPNTQLCFTASVIPRGWDFVGWQANGGSPSTQSGGFQFCTTFNDSQPIPRSVSLRFQDPCTGQIRQQTASSFIICPASVCP